MLDIIPTLKNLDEQLLQETRKAFEESYQVLWQVMTGITSIGLLASLLMRHVPLHKATDDDWGMKELKNKQKESQISDI